LHWQVYRKVNGEMLNSSFVPTDAISNLTAISDDGIIQLVIPKTYTNDGNCFIDYTATASSKGINYSPLFCSQILKMFVKNCILCIM